MPLQRKKSSPKITFLSKGMCQVALVRFSMRSNLLSPNFATHNLDTENDLLMPVLNPNPVWKSFSPFDLLPSLLPFSLSLCLFPTMHQTLQSVRGKWCTFCYSAQSVFKPLDLQTSQYLKGHMHAPWKEEIVLNVEGKRWIKGN